MESFDHLIHVLEAQSDVSQTLLATEADRIKLFVLYTCNFPPFAIFSHLLPPLICVNDQLVKKSLESPDDWCDAGSNIRIRGNSCHEVKEV